MIKKVSTPLTKEKLKSLQSGDIVEISGTMFTARDLAHKYFSEHPDQIPINLKNQIIYHSGPIIIKKSNIWQVKAAGPTTSMREEPYEATFIQKFGIRGIIGKGGMGEKTKKACKKYGCIYFHTIGGAAQVLGACITKVKNVYMLKEFGPAEAIWELEVKNFPGIVG